MAAFGGDGTFNEVAAGIAESSTALAVLPGASTTCSPAASGAQRPDRRRQALYVPALKADHVRRVGLGVVNGRYFCFHPASATTRPSSGRSRSGPLVERWVGHPLFIYAALGPGSPSTTVGHPHFAVDFPGRGAPVPDGYFTVVLNSSPNTFLGNRPLDLSPTPRSIGSGAHHLPQPAGLAVPAHARADVAMGARSRPRPPSTSATISSAFTIESARPFPYQVDGDYLGETRRLRFEHRPEVMDLVFPLSRA